MVRHFDDAIGAGDLYEFADDDVEPDDAVEEEPDDDDEDDEDEDDEDL